MDRFVRRVWFGVMVVALVALSLVGTTRADMLYAVNATTQALEVINTSTLTVTTIGPLGVVDNYGGLAYDTANKTLYLLDGRSQKGLYTVNMTTGAATLVGVHGITDLFGLGYDSKTNTLYGSQFATGNQFYSLNVATGAATLIGSTGLTIGVGGLAYNPNTASLIGVASGLGTFYTINEATGANAYLASPGQNNDGGLAYDTTRNVYWDIDYSGNLYSIDPAHNYTRTLRLSGLSPQDGLAFVSTAPGAVTIPEPPSGLMLGIGVVTLVGSLRRRRERVAIGYRAG